MRQRNGIGAFSAVKWIMILFILVIIIAFFVFGVKWVKKFFGLDDDGKGKGNNDEEEADDIWSPTEYNPNGGVVTSGFDADFYVTRLNEVLNDWKQSWSTSNLRCNTLIEVNQLNDNQIIAIGNRYKAVFRKTLAKELQEVWGSGCLSPFSNPDEDLLRRLNKLKVK